MLTFVIISAVVATSLGLPETVVSLPSGVALAAPLALEVGLAHAVASPDAALGRAALQGAVPAVPAGDAQARTVLALTVLGTAGIARPTGAGDALPAGLAHAPVVLTPAGG